jgi:hypothetical protein
MIRIIFGDSLALAVQRRWDRVGRCFFWGALLFKLLGQGFFYVRRPDAEALDIAFLLLAHAFIAIAASGGFRSDEGALRGRAVMLEVDAALGFIRGFAGILAVTVALAILKPFLPYPDHKHGIKSEYYTFAAARALVPYLFWTTMMAYSSILNKSTHKSSLGEELPADT